MVGSVFKMPTEPAELLPELKEDMRGVCYNDLEALESVVTVRVRILENGCLAKV